MDKKKNQKANSEDEIDVEFHNIEETESVEILIKNLKSKIKNLEKEKSLLLDNLQRAKADFINLRKRDEKEKTDSQKYLASSIIIELIPIVDSLEQALSHIDVKKDDLISGIESIRKQFLEILQRFYVKQYDPINEVFDPKKHEAIGIKKVDSTEKENIIVEVHQKGYWLHDKLIRFPKVFVGEIEK